MVNTVNYKFQITSDIQLTDNNLTQIGHQIAQSGVGGISHE